MEESPGEDCRKSFGGMTGTRVERTRGEDLNKKRSCI